MFSNTGWTPNCALSIRRPDAAVEAETFREFNRIKIQNCRFPVQFSKFDFSCMRAVGDRSFAVRRQQHQETCSACPAGTSVPRTTRFVRGFSGPRDQYSQAGKYAAQCCRCTALQVVYPESYEHILRPAT